MSVKSYIWYKSWFRLPLLKCGIHFKLLPSIVDVASEIEIKDQVGEHLRLDCL